MIEIRSLKVGSWSPAWLDVTWEVVPSTEDMEEYAFRVECSESEGGPFIPHSKWLIDKYRFRDVLPNQLSNTRRYFYRLAIRHIQSDDVVFSAVTSREGELPIDARRIVELKERYYRSHAGALFYLFPLRTFGQHCPQCYDPYTRRKRDDRCPLCYATGFTGGYHYPIPFWGQKDPHEESHQVTSSTNLQTRMTRITTNPSPDIKAGDLVVDRVNARFIVSSVSGTTRFGINVQQQLTCIGVQVGSIQEKVPLLLDSNLVTTAQIPYKYPTALDVEGDAFADVFGGYYGPE